MQKLSYNVPFGALGLVGLIYRYGIAERKIINIGDDQVLEVSLKDVQLTNMIAFDKISYWIDMKPERYSPMFKRNIYSLSRVKLGEESYNVWEDLYKGRFRL